MMEIFGYPLLFGATDLSAREIMLLKLRPCFIGKIIIIKK